MATRMQQRRGTASQWTTANPILAAGEIGFETDTSKFKIGDSVNTWDDLEYFTSAAEIANIIDGAPDLLNTLNELAAAVNDDPTFFTTVATNLSDHEADTMLIHGIADTAQIATKTYADTAVSTHQQDTTEVHGIADTAALATKTYADGAVSTHNSDTTNVHGIADTSALAIASTVASDISSAITAHSDDTTNVHGIADTTAIATQTNVTDAVSGHNSDTTSVHGIADTSLLAIATTVASDISSAISTHSSDTTNIHGITDASLLVTTTGTQTLSDKTLNSPTISISSILREKTGSQAVVADNATTLIIQDPYWASGQWTTSSSAVGASVVLTGTTGLDGTYRISAVSIGSGDVTFTVLDTLPSTGNWQTASNIKVQTSSNISSTELSYLDTVSSNIQTQLNAKAPLNSPTFTGTVTLPANTISQSMMGDDSVGTNEIGGLAVTTEKIANSAVTTEKIATGAVTKSMVGLGNVDNTADADKPVSDDTQDALDLKADLAGATFTGNVEVDGSLVVDGDFTVNGTNFSASATSITIEDNLIQLAHQNAVNTVDLGLVVGYNDGAAKHAGIARDVSDDKWKLFKGVTTEPTTTVAFGEGSLDALAVGALEATTVTPSSGIVFSDGTQTKEGTPSKTPIIQKTASYELSALTERDNLIEMSSSSAMTLTIPTDATLDFPIGTSLDILQTSTGQVTIAGASGVTVNSTPGLKLRTTWSSATLFKRAADTWVVYGDLTA